MVGQVKFIRTIPFGIFFLFVLASCSPKDYTQIPTYSGKGSLQAVIESPAGTNLRISYCAVTHRFKVEMDEKAGKRVNFLPYPVNFGFVPSTRLTRRPEDAGELVDILVISEKLETGEIIDVIPLGILILKDDFITDYRVISIPADPLGQVVSAGSLSELNEKYPSLTAILEEWFLYSDVYKNAEVMGWEDEHIARQFIDKWRINN
jgi:inorganic pyrophosphatase